MDRLKSKDEEINKAILEWIITKNYKNTIEQFLNETNLKTEDATKGSILEKKWGTILLMQKKISDLETQVKQLKEELDNATITSGGGGVMIKKENESMVS
jgi:platelet-activating factor acetylhydrolase IB subunit alpha